MLIPTNKLYNKLLYSIVLTILFSFIYMIFDDDEFIINFDRHDNFDVLHHQYFRRLYFSIITQTTVGFGDVIPNSNRCRLLVSIQSLSTLILSYI